MELGMVGLGRMGANMVERLVRGGHRVVGYDRDAGAVARVTAAGAGGADSLAALASKLTGKPRAIWIMVPSGAPVDDTIAQLIPHLTKGDILIDGGNSNYKDTQRRAASVKGQGLQFVDVGTSGGIWGYSMMVGGDKASVEYLRPLLETLAPAKDQGWGHVGPSGAGHFVKMVHNGIEYGMMQAYAEGFAILKKKNEFSLDMHQVSEIWRTGSVVRSWLLDLLR
jgi:6-phosphogluconate dehydrogenase